MRAVWTLSLVLLSTAMSAQDVSLKGITQVQVDLAFSDGEGTGSCAEKVLAKVFGLLKDEVRTETELRLREAGLRIGPGQILRITVTGCASAVAISVELREWATVEVRKRRCVVTTWKEDAVALYPSDVRAIIRERVSSFVNQWLAEK